MDLFFAEKANISANEIVVDDFERKHILQAMRKSSGDEIFITDGQGILYRSRLQSEKPKLKLQILSRQQMPKPQQHIALAIGYIRPARLDFIFEKGTELGIIDFYLIRTSYANYYSDNLTRYQKILRQALKQSQQFYLPQITPMSSLKEFLRHGQTYDNKIAAIDATYPSLFHKINQIHSESPSSFLYIVGPEGGFSEDEVELFDTTGFLLVSIGNTRLRAETAAISGISLIQQYMQQ